ncbi:ribosomal protein S12e, 50S ribosomal protein L30e-like protein [Artemisia annua]|uniref:Ribosomal protein S12e, 50S ribosomal protein L30e-like protein n=1 Tax=Artemisia annua TaxID=35608 RepID=A0A2U1NQF6_ARTAN|nr:ribosomal protein S12e, 50S ribosomal protein L30e-like protein [Artemisia annua]
MDSIDVLGHDTVLFKDSEVSRVQTTLKRPRQPHVKVGEGFTLLSMCGGGFKPNGLIGQKSQGFTLVGNFLVYFNMARGNLSRGANNLEEATSTLEGFTLFSMCGGGFKPNGLIGQKRVILVVKLQLKPGPNPSPNPKKKKMSDDTLMAILKEEADRYLSLYVFIGNLTRELAKKERCLEHPVCYNINCIIWSLCELKDSILDMRDIRVRDVSTLVDNSRSKIINLLNELYDNVKLSKLTVKQKIKDYTVEFEKESIAAFKRHMDIDLKLLLSYGKDVDDVPLNKNTLTLISKRSDDDITTEKNLWSFLNVGSGSHKSPKEEYKQEEKKEEEKEENHNSWNLLWVNYKEVILKRFDEKDYNAQKVFEEMPVNKNLKQEGTIVDFNVVPEGWGGYFYPWVVELSKGYPLLEEIRLKRIVVSDDCLEVIGKSFKNFGVLVLVLASCEGFSTDGLAANCSKGEHRSRTGPDRTDKTEDRIKAKTRTETETETECSPSGLVRSGLRSVRSNKAYFGKNLRVLDLQECDVEDLSGHWLSHFPDSFTSLETLNMACLGSEVSFSALERLGIVFFFLKEKTSELTLKESEDVAVPVEVAAPAPALGEPMDIMTALQLVLRKSLAHGGLVRGLHGAAKPDYIKLVALCADHNVSLVTVPSAKTLGEWAGLCKIDSEGKARKVVGCSCLVVKDYGEESEGLHIVQEYVKSR